MEREILEVESLVINVQNGDNNAFSRIYELYKNRLYYKALNKTSNSQDAEDIVQTTFIEAYNSIQSLKEPKAFTAFIYTILRRKCSKYYTKKIKDSQEIKYIDENFDMIADDGLEITPDYAAISQETKETVETLIKELPDEQAECIFLHYFEELGTREIAEMLDMPEGTVKSRLNYARKKIKDKIEESRRRGKPLVAVFPLPLLTYLLRELAEQNKLSAQASVNIANSIENACGIKMSPNVSTVGTEVATTVTKVGMSAITKILIGLTAAGILYVAAKPSEPNNNKPAIPTDYEMQLDVEPSNETVLSGTNNIATEDLNLSKLPESWSDYAKIYYDYIQTDLKKLDSEEFIDAEMADIDGDEKPELIVSYKDIDTASLGTNIYMLQLSDDNERGYSIEYYEGDLNSEGLKHFSSDSPIAFIPYDSAVWFFYNDNGRALLCRYSKIDKFVVPANDSLVISSIDGPTITYVDYVHLTIIDSLEDGWSEYEIRTNYNTGIRYGLHASWEGFAYHLAHTIDYDEAKSNIDKYMNVTKQYGTWGYAYVGEGEGFTFENTGGERLRDYFED